MSEKKEARKLKRLEQAGWKTTTVQEFLGLSNAEMDVIEVKVALARRLHAQRARAGLSQVEVAKIVRSSQPRVAKMEAADRTVSIDLLVRALLRTGVSVQEIGRSLERCSGPRTKSGRASTPRVGAGKALERTRTLGITTPGESARIVRRMRDGA